MEATMKFMKFTSLWLLGIVTLCALSQSSSNINAAARSPRGRLQDNENMRSGSLKLSVRDSVTGRFVRPKITYVNSKDGIPTLLSNNVSGDNRYKLTRGRYDLEISAAGHQTLKTHLEIEPQAA